MKPFDLELALAGCPVVTRDGREVTQITLFKIPCDPVVGVVDGMLITWPKSGEYQTSEKSVLDLFMAPKKRTVWVNVYPEECHYGYDTKKRADELGGKARIGGKAWPLEIEE